MIYEWTENRKNEKYIWTRIILMQFQGADTLEKIVTFNKQLRQFKKVHERLVLHKKYPLTKWIGSFQSETSCWNIVHQNNLGFSFELNSCSFHIYVRIFRKSSFIRNKLLTEESLREDSMEEENYIPEVWNQHLYHFHSLLSIIIITI